MPVSKILLAAVLLLPLAAHGQDAAAGAKIFNKCKVCHTAVKGGPNRTGPNLFAIVGKGAAENPTYKYSPAMAALKGNKTWSEKELDSYLANPKTVVPGSKMIFPGLKDATDRANLIAWLKAQK